MTRRIIVALLRFAMRIYFRRVEVARRALALEVLLGARELDGQLVLALGHVRAQLVLQLRQVLASLAAATLGLFLDGRQGALPSVLVDVRDDVQGEIEDSLEVARADIEQDAEPTWRALEVPDVADRAGQLDVAHPLAADLGTGSPPRRTCRR